MLQIDLWTRQLYETKLLELCFDYSPIFVGLMNDTAAHYLFCGNITESQRKAISN